FFDLAVCRQVFDRRSNLEPPGGARHPEGGGVSDRVLLRMGYFDVCASHRRLDHLERSVQDADWITRLAHSWGLACHLQPEESREQLEALEYGRGGGWPAFCRLSGRRSRPGGRSKAKHCPACLAAPVSEY